MMMRVCTRARLVPFVLCATGALVLFLAGCRKEEAKPEIPASSPQSYMNDKAFMGKLKEKRKARASTMARHHEAYVAYQEALKADPKGEKPETKALHEKMIAIENEYQALERETMRFVRDRLAPVRGQGSGVRDQKEKTISK